MRKMLLDKIVMQRIMVMKMVIRMVRMVTVGMNCSVSSSKGAGTVASISLEISLEI